MATSTRVPSERDELTRAARELALPESEFRILAEPAAASHLAGIEAHFVKEAGHRWWWEAFRDAPTASHDFRDAAGHCWGASYLTCIAPPDSGIIWLVVKASPRFVLCEGTVDAIQSVVWESGVSEYYLVPKSLDWLVCENHHAVVIAIGEAVAERLAQVGA
jgi:hypothetical protein